MLKYEDVLVRVLQLPQYHGWDSSDFMLQILTNQYAISGSGQVTNQAMTMPPGAVIIGMMGGATGPAAASTQLQKPGLEMFSIGLNYQQQFGLVGQSQVIGSALFGPFNDQFPAKEIIIPQNGSLLISLTNLETDAITVWIAAHCLVPSQLQ